MGNPRPKGSDVRFTRKQLEELEKLFPALVLNHKYPVDMIREYFGQQQVIEAVRSRVQSDAFVHGS